MLTKDLSTAKRIQPCFIEPMYAELCRELPDGGAWTYEAKLDGYRCLAANRAGRVVLVPAGQRFHRPISGDRLGVREAPIGHAG